MRKYLILFKILVIIVVTSCNDEIENIQPFVEGNPDTFFNSVRSFQVGVDGIYEELRKYYQHPNRGLQGIPDIVSDNVVLVQTGRRSNKIYYDYNYTPNSTDVVPFYFNGAYKAISGANLIIGKIDNLLEGDDKNNILGQALAARAIAHFDLVRIYAKIPTQSADANSSLGIVYVKVEDGDNVDPYAKPSRETVASNYKEIIGDLEKASTIIGSDKIEGRLNKDAVFGILSRIYLYNGDYQKAIEAADKVSTPLAKAEELADMYMDETNAGIVLEFPINTSSETSENNVGTLYSQTISGNPRSEYAIEYDFFNSISDTDIRKKVMQLEGTFNGNKYNAIKKFIGEKGQVNGRVDIKVIRAAEVLLNKAEAQYNLGLTAESLASLDELRAERTGGSGVGGETGTALENAIQLNRRIELAFEGHRFFDLKRRGESIIRSDKGDIIDGSGTPADVLTLSAGDFRFQFPIPIAERNANPNFEQNTGY